MFINLNFQFGFCYFIFRTSDLGLFLTFWNRFLERFIISQIYNFLRFKMIKKLVVWKIIYGVQICTEVLTLLKTASFHILSFLIFPFFDFLLPIFHFRLPVFHFPFWFSRFWFSIFLFNVNYLAIKFWLNNCFKKCELMQ